MSKPKKSSQRRVQKPKRIRTVYNLKAEAPKDGFKCLCGCGGKTTKLFMRGHVGRFIKLLTSKDLAYVVGKLKEAKARLK